MAVNLSPVGGVAGQFFDNNGDPLVGGKLFTFAAGTTTPQVTYTSSSGSTPNSNPIILNGGGRVPSEIWLTDGLMYKFVLYTSDDQLIGSWDNIIGINSNFVNFTAQQELQTATAGQTVFTLTTMQYAPGTNSLTVFVDGVNQYGPGAQYAYVETSPTVITFTNGLHVGAEVKFTTAQSNTSAATNAVQVTYDPAGTGAVATNVQAKLRETVSVKDFGAVGDGVTDDTAAIQAALDASANKTLVYIDGATYLVSAALNIPTGSRHVGKAKVKAANSAAIATGLFNATTGSDIVFDGLELDGNADNTGVMYGINISGVNRVFVKNCYIHDTRQAGIRLGDCNGVVVDSNNVIDCGRTGFTDNHGIMVYAVAGASKDISISGNTVKSAFRKGITLYNATPGSVANAQIVGNSVRDCQLGGIFVANPSAATNPLMEGVTVVANNVDNCPVNLEIACVDGGTVVGNYAANTTNSQCIAVADCKNLTINSNSVVNSEADGIKVIGITIVCENISINGNVVSLSSQAGIGTYDGILLQNVNYSIVTDNIIIGESASPKQAYGVSETGTSNFNVIANNSIYNTHVGDIASVGQSTVMQTLDASGTFSQISGLSWPERAITLANGDNNNVALPVKSLTLYVAGPTGAFAITGIAGGTKGRKIVVFNYTTQTMTISHNSGSSSAGNKILVGGATDMALGAFGCVELTYFSNASAWVVTGQKG
jgi:parallel beta-helix repeat protein